MKKRIMCIYLLVLLCVISICSCLNKTKLFNEQSNINLNYNNIIAYNSFWLTNDSICYLQDSLIQNYYMVTTKSKIKICQNGGMGYGKIQRYGQQIYLLDEIGADDEFTSNFRLKSYDVNSKKVSYICNIQNCDNYLVLNNSVYYLSYEWKNYIYCLSLYRYSLETKKHELICDDVFSFGVIENRLFYLSEEEDYMAIYQYDDKENTSIRQGQFKLEQRINKTYSLKQVSYTKDYVFVIQTDGNNNTTKIWRYSFKEDTVTYKTVSGYCDVFISYDKMSYCLISYQDSDAYKLMRLNNEAYELEEIAQILGGADLFVASDDGVYVSEYESNILKYYSDKNAPRIVYRF